MCIAVAFILPLDALEPPQALQFTASEWIFGSRPFVCAYVYRAKPAAAQSATTLRASGGSSTTATPGMPEIRRLSP